MRLFEHPDFDQIVIATHDHFGLPRLAYEIIEKDYYVTEALRILADNFPGRLSSKASPVFRKAGTSSNAFQRISIFL